jgi:eukaryotic-like serine/threonine-protein kinase
MADVYLADDVRTGQAVAVKLLRPEAAADPDYVARFKREAQAAMALDHPRIVRAFDCGAADTSYYLAMDYVAGSTLKQLIAERGPLREEVALRLAAEVADALEYAHRRGVIHRDVKPQNILLDEEGHVRLTDFGIARFMGAQQAQTTGVVLGTVDYLSPEQARGERVDQRSDIYSLGIVLFELLTGRLPFAGDSALSVALKQANEPAPSPRRWSPRVSAATEAITFRALARDVDQRFASAGALAAALRSAQETATNISLDAAPTQAVAVPRADPARDGHLSPWRGTTGSPAPVASRARMPASGRLPVMRITLGIGVVAALVLAVLVLGAGAKVLSGMAAAHVAVPNLVGSAPEDAAKLLADRGLELAVAESIYSDVAAVGAISTQSPESGVRVESGSTVSVQLSLGEAPVEVPDLRGLPAEAVGVALQQAGLALGTMRVTTSTTLAAGRVVAQAPGPGTEVSPNSAVDLVLSSGPPPAASAPPGPSAASSQAAPAPPADNRAPAPAQGGHAPPKPKKKDR